MTQPLSLSRIHSRAPDLDPAKALALAEVWDEVVHRIIQSMLDREKDKDRVLHINLRAEMSFEVSRLLMFFTESVMDKRIGDRQLDAIDPSLEREACFDAQGVAMIEKTAEEFHAGYWSKRMEERWLPKARKALARDASPAPRTRLAVKPVRDKHFISRWMIRDHWSTGDTTVRWRRRNDGWSRRQIPYGTWGHRRGLWSDRLEAYFGLLEGDAKRPFEMLLRIEPLNQPQEMAFVAHLVMHILRNPQMILGLRHHMRDMLESAARDAGMDFEEIARSAYETLYGQHEVYDAYARPLLWSRWAIVSSPAPLFVLPDTFCARGAIDGEPRVFAPLTPYKCFVTLAKKEDPKVIVPMQHQANEGLARQISRLLVAASASEFLAHPEFALPEEGQPPEFLNVLADLQTALGSRD